MVGKWLVISTGWGHPGFFAQGQFAKLLSRFPDTEFQQANSLNALTPLRQKGKPPLNEQFAGILLFNRYRRVAPEALDCLVEFVERGGGFVALHDASASCPDLPEFEELVGGRYLLTEELREIELIPTHGVDEILGELAHISLHELPCLHACDPQNTVHYHARLGERVESIIWSRQQGNGRVFYCGVGHHSSALRHPMLERVLRAGLAWAAAVAPPESGSSQEGEVDAVVEAGIQPPE